MIISLLKIDFILVDFRFCFLMERKTRSGGVMTKEELIDEIAKKAGVSKDEVSLVINAFIDQIKEKLDRGEKVEIPGFGSFILSDKEK